MLQIETADQRKLEIGEKMAAREAERKERLKEKEMLSEANPEEEVYTVFQSFSEKHTGLRTTLAEIEQHAADGLGVEEIEVQLDALRAEMLVVKDFVNANCLHLPPFDQRSMQQKMSKFEEERAAAHNKLVPRKKFSFKKKDKKKKSAAASVMAAEADSRHSDAAISATEETPSCTKGNTQEVHDPERSIVDRNGETIVVEGAKLAGGDFFIQNCSDCRILLKGSMGALRMKQVSHCTIVSGPVTGGCLIEAAEDCKFYLVAHQMRLHDSYRTDFYLHMRSNPIIEDCSGLRFAPYAEHYDGLQEELEQTELTPDRCGDMWSHVNDFKWLRQQQSPNWCVLPENERVGSQLN